MSPAGQTSTVVNNNMLLTYLQERLLKTLDEQVFFYQLCEKYPLPDKSGTSMIFNGWRRISAPSSVLSEQSSNVATVLSSRKITATIASYGQVVKVSDLSEKTLISSPVQGAITRLMQAASLALDNVCQLAIYKNTLDQVGKDTNAKTKLLSAYMSALASSFCANTGTTANSLQFGFPVVFGTSAARLSAVSKTAPSISARFGAIAVRKAVDRLRLFDAQPFADGNFLGVLHPTTMTTALGNPDVKQWFLNWSGGPQQSLFKGTITAPIHGARFIMSTNTPRYRVAAHSCSMTAIISESAVGVTELSGGVEMIVKTGGEQDTSNPFNLYTTVAYKLRAGAAVLNPSAGVIVATHDI